MDFYLINYHNIEKCKELFSLQAHLQVWERQQPNYFSQGVGMLLLPCEIQRKKRNFQNLKNVTVLPLDVTNIEQIKSTIAKAISLNNIDVVFNNAGYGLMGAMEAFTDEQIVKLINTNLLGVLRVTQEFIPYFREKKSGLFISTTSMGGLLAFPLHSIYHATKFGLEGWSESMSFELSLFNIGIKTIAPGGIETDFTGRSLDKKPKPEYQKLEDKLFSVVNDMQATSTAEQIAEVVYEAATDGKGPSSLRSRCRRKSCLCKTCGNRK